MEIKTLDCPIIGLDYTEHITNTHTYYTLEPKKGYKLRTMSSEFPDEEGHIEPSYCTKIAMPKAYDFEKNPMGIVSEKE